MRGFFKIFIFLIVGLWSCEPPNEIIDSNYQGGFTFSTDTILFDTLFSSRGSTAQRFYVRNQHTRALKLNTISLGKAGQSSYTLTVNGVESKKFNDITILGKDSLLVLVTVLIDPMDEDLPYLVKDSVVFSSNGTQQNIKLVAWGQDANYLGDSVIACNSVWDADRPYVLYNSILVDSLCSLEIEKGVRIFCAPNSFVFVKGTLRIRGEANDRILIRNDRLEPVYENALGQWGGIVFLEGSKDNRIEYATIRNGQTGIRVGSPDNDTIPDVILKNVIIENMSDAGILSFTSDIYADNTLINNCKNLVLANIAGGSCTYVNCTFANFSFDFIRETPVSYFSDYLVLENDDVLKADMDLTIINSIIYGDLEDEIQMNFSGETVVELLFANNIIKTNNDELNINNNIINEDPKFKSAFNYDFHLDTLSPAINAGLDVGLEIDLDSVTRDNQQDIGAYEYIIE